MKAGLSLHVIPTGRDLLIFKLNRKQVMVVSCDAAGGIGSKKLDELNVAAATVGRFTARVALMEVMSVNATPIGLTATLPVERKPTGAAIMRGVRREFGKVRPRPEDVVLESTEKNVAVGQTGVGITVFGVTDYRVLKVGHSKPGDAMVSVGLPYVGADVIAASRRHEIADLSDIKKLLRLRAVHEIVPVGSRGILHEAKTIARESNVKFLLEQPRELDVRKSAGPGTVLLCSLATSDIGRLRSATQKPLNVVGFLKSQ